MSSVKERLGFLVKMYRGTRAAGHTTLLMKGAKHNGKEFMLVTHDLRYGTILKRENNLSQAHLVSWGSLDSAFVDGKKMPVAMDNSALMHILADTYEEIDVRDQRVAELLRQLQVFRGCWKDLQFASKPYGCKLPDPINGVVYPFEIVDEVLRLLREQADNIKSKDQVILKLTSVRQYIIWKWKLLFKSKK